MNRDPATKIQFVCDHCVGTGYQPVNSFEIDACPECDGTGLIDHLPRLQSYYDDILYVNGDRYQKVG
ncbi:MAG: hypothetical protein CMK96_09985 [Pseudomonas sp.]|jgi:DnaJ-class molecular chaperone|nr:hypothetical protein [Pseudomonas sp.]|tara:strand:+ start:1265 stop:1465 length:201 start_codon:yes stop_codon:yes gene_type:complete